MKDEVYTLDLIFTSLLIVIGTDQIHMNRFKNHNSLRPKKVNVVFLLSRPTLMFCADPKVFIAIFRQRLLKSDLFFYIMLIKKSDKIKKNSIPTYPIFFSNESRNTTLIF